MSRYPEADEAQRWPHNDGYDVTLSRQPSPHQHYDIDEQDRNDYSPQPPHISHQPSQPAPRRQQYASYGDPFRTGSPLTGPAHEHLRSSPLPSSSLPNSAPGSANASTAAFDSGDIPLLPSRSHHATFSASRNRPSPVPRVVHPDGSIRYSRIPQNEKRRYKTTKTKLVNGNFVVDQRVPKKLLDLSPSRADREFTHMRYSAVTCDPDDFRDCGFDLRQRVPHRATEIFIVVTMYNEDVDLFCRTMHSVMQNIAYLCTKGGGKPWGVDGWQKVVVCIVSDGRATTSSKTLSVLATMGVYQEGVAKGKVLRKPVQAHVFEYTTQVSVQVTPSLRIEGVNEGIVPVQIIFCLKEKNQKKINSHRWFFNAFGPILKPRVCVLIDVGTVAGDRSIYHLWKEFDINPHVGGACGEVKVYKGRMSVKLFNPLVAAQNYEYKMSNILDKPLESVFGYITVLPGAFSAYRYRALQGDRAGEGPLKKYFGEVDKAGARMANMYLAEDRILCWELVSKRGRSWTLRYVKSAHAFTDVPDQVPEFISQRRRWLNGSFFAAVHHIMHFHHIYRSAHGLVWMFCVHIELLYQSVNLIFSWFSLANYYIAFAILSDSMEDESFQLKGVHILNIIINYFYLGLLAVSFTLSMGNRPQGSKWAYTLVIIAFAAITLYMVISALFLVIKGIQHIADVEGRAISFKDIFRNSTLSNIVLSLLVTLAVQIISSLLFLDPWHMMTSFIQYLLMAQSYSAVLNVYAFANVHDVSWGTKSDDQGRDDDSGPTDLAIVTQGQDEDLAQANLPTSTEDIDLAYRDAEVYLKKELKIDPKLDSRSAAQEDLTTFRTYFVLAWMLSNALLGATIVNINGRAKDIGASKTLTQYMAFLLYSVAALALFRFVGSTIYLIVRLLAD